MVRTQATTWTGCRLREDQPIGPPRVIYRLFFKDAKPPTHLPPLPVCKNAPHFWASEREKWPAMAETAQEKIPSLAEVVATLPLLFFDFFPPNLSVLFV